MEIIKLRKRQIVSYVGQLRNTKVDTNKLILLLAFWMAVFIVVALDGFFRKKRLLDAMLEDEDGNAIGEDAELAIQMMSTALMVSSVCGCLGCLYKVSTLVSVAAILLFTYAVAIALVGVWYCFYRGGIRAVAKGKLALDPSIVTDLIVRLLGGLHFPLLDSGWTLFISHSLWHCAQQMDEEAWLRCADESTSTTVQDLKRMIVTYVRESFTEFVGVKKTRWMLAGTVAYMMFAAVGLLLKIRLFDAMLEDGDGKAVDEYAELAIQMMYGALLVASLCGFIGLRSKDSVLLLMAAILFFTYSATVCLVAVCHCYHSRGFEVAANVQSYTDPTLDYILDYLFLTKLRLPVFDLTVSPYLSYSLYDCAVRIDDESRRRTCLLDVTN